MNIKSRTGSVIISYPGPPQYNGGNISYNGSNTVHTFTNSGTLETVPVTRPWLKWFAWRPVKIKGRWSWLKTVYRRPILKTYATINEWTRYEYGDLFDVLAEKK